MQRNYIIRGAAVMAAVLMSLPMTAEGTGFFLDFFLGGLSGVVTHPHRAINPSAVGSRLNPHEPVDHSWRADVG